MLPAKGIRDCRLENQGMIKKNKVFIELVISFIKVSLWFPILCLLEIKWNEIDFWDT